MLFLESHVSAALTTLLVIVLTLVLLSLWKKAIPQQVETDRFILDAKYQKPSRLSKLLAEALPDSVIFPDQTGAFKESTITYWAQQQCENLPNSVVLPSNAEELSIAVNIINKEYEEQLRRPNGVAKEGLFAVRSGGHSPVPRASCVKGGILIDLSRLRQINLSKDGCEVEIGSGARWMDVSKVLDERGLAVVGGRNSAVGVGGLTLGGGLSFFSPRYGLVCSNILSYEVVLASGAVVTASSMEHPRLWRALKGGANNFGIVTRFTARSFPADNIWSGFLYMPSFQADKVLIGLHEFVDRGRHETPGSYDENAAGPIACFSYIGAINIQLISVNLVYTKPLEDGKWPQCWKSSSLTSLWRFWSTCKTRSISNATHELTGLNPPGRRQIFAPRTIKNHLETLRSVYAAFNEVVPSLRKANVKGLVWTLVMQPLLPDWVKRGDPNPLGLENSDTPLVVVSFTVNWNERKDDQVMRSTTRHVIKKMDAIAIANKAKFPWLYLNYCGWWQRPFETYGEKNHRFLLEASKEYDPEGLFQYGCVGGFKLTDSRPSQ